MSDYRRLVGRRVLIQLDDLTLDGTLERDDKETLTLAQASAISGGESAPIDGEVVVDRARIIWTQVP